MHLLRMVMRMQVVAVSVAAIFTIALANERGSQTRRSMIYPTPIASEKFFDLSERKYPHKRGLFAKLFGAITGNNEESENAPVITITSVHGYPGHRYAPGNFGGYYRGYGGYGGYGSYGGFGGYGMYRNGGGFGSKGFANAGGSFPQSHSFKDFGSSSDAYAPQTSALSNSFGSYSPQGFVSHGSSANGDTVKTITITKEVPVPYPVHVEKKVPYPVKVPVDRPVPVQVPKPYAVHVDKPVPYPVKVPVKVPVPVTVERHVPFAVKVPVDKPIPIHIPRPFPVYIEKKIPYPVEKHIPYAVRYPVERPYPVHFAIDKPFIQAGAGTGAGVGAGAGPIPGDKKVPYPVKFSIDSPFSSPFSRPYPIEIEHSMNYPVGEKPIVVPIKLPFHIPYPVEVKVPLHIPFMKTPEHNHSSHGFDSFKSGENSGFGGTYSGFDGSNNSSHSSTFTGGDFGGHLESGYFGNHENESGVRGEGGRFTNPGNRHPAEQEYNPFGESPSSGQSDDGHGGTSSHESNNDAYNFNFDSNDSDNNSSGGYS